MTQQDVTFQQVTVSEAADILGVSTQTVRRMLKRGQLEGQRVHRPQGTAFVVTLPVEATGDTQDATVTQQSPPNVSRSNATPSEQMATLAAAFLTPVLAPLVAEITASRQAGERKDDIIRVQAETIGELRATVATLEARTAAQTVEPPTESTGALQAFLTRWWPLVAMLIVACVVAAALVWALVPR